MHQTHLFKFLLIIDKDAISSGDGEFLKYNLLINFQEDFDRIFFDYRVFQDGTEKMRILFRAEIFKNIHIYSSLFRLDFSEKFIIAIFFIPFMANR